MKLSEETTSLLKRDLRQAIGPIEVLGAAVLSTVAFGVAFACHACDIRDSSPGLATVGGLALIAVALLTTALGALRWKQKKSSRGLLVTAIALWAGVLVGNVVGNNWYYLGVAKFSGLKKMASYVNIDPSADNAQAFQDAGILYFKDGTKVMRSKALAFRNGLTYCVAPIALEPLEGESNKAKKTAEGFNIPSVGSLDYWAVGTDCCGNMGTPFNCHDAGSLRARSGLRVLEDSHRAMYRLAVQEWSATTGIPAKHPMFFEYVKDPLQVEDDLKNMAGDHLPAHLMVYFLAALFISYILNMVLRHWKVY